MNAYVKGLRKEASDLRAQSVALHSTLIAEGRGMNVDEITADDTRNVRMDQLKAEISRYERLEKSAIEATPPASSERRPYATLGHQLVDVMRAETTRNTPESLRAFGWDAMAAASGLNEGTAAEGGYFVQTDIASGIKEKLYEIGSFLSRVNRLTIGPNSNGTKIPAVDETSRADGSRYGGLRAYWVAEAGTITPSKPKFRQIELSLKKLAGLCYCTDEMLADSGLLAQFITQRMPQEMLYTIEDALFFGSGAGKPLGFLTSGAVKTQGLISDQSLAANPITIENVLGMYSSMWPRSRPNAVWYISTTVEPHLMTLKIGDTPVWIPPGGLSATPYATLFGRPVIPVEYCSALGTIGDIIFADPTQYTYIEKGGVQQAQSMHVRFLQDEMAFRFTIRCDGQPEWNSTLTAKDGVTTYAPFVTLDTRS